MKTPLLNLSVFLKMLAITLFLLATANQISRANQAAGSHTPTTPSQEALRKATLKILETKCNVCHRKQNPFMVFNERNMNKRAKRINKQVFVQKRMPKGDAIQLTDAEYKTLKNWIFTTLNAQ